MFRRAFLFLVVLAASWWTGPAPAGGPAPRASLPHSTDRLIVKLREDAGALQSARLSELSSAAGVPLSVLRRMSDGAYVLRMRDRHARAFAEVLAARLHFRPDVLYAEADVVFEPQRTPDDPLFASQWHYFEPAGGIRLPEAWDVTIGSNGITVAVIDSGLAVHADFAGRVVPGYDFVSDPRVANDGDGRDGNAADPGDWITAAESSAGFFIGCPITSSSWHGTHVAGTIAATTDNALGVSGVSWASKLLPVRTIGKCGGFLSDIVDGMRWAAGLAVSGAPVNANPARVLNLSLGASGPCSATLQNAVNSVTAAGAVVVVAAGNAASDAAGHQPASCSGVIAVGATTRTGAKASYSNFGARVAISAPGSGVLSTANTGEFGPVADTYLSYNGTSMATPHVSGVVSLMLSVNPALTVDEIRGRLLASARPFPTGTESDCAVGVCGAGVVDAGAAVLAALAPSVPTIISASPETVAPGGTVTAEWSGIAAPSPTDWIGVYVPGATPNQFFHWIYVSCSRTATTAQAAGACPLTLPASLAPGTYELRLMANNGYTRLATSGTFTVPAPPGPSLTVAPASVASGDTVTADWSGINAPSATDWVALYAPGAAPTAFIAWIYVSCSKTPAAARAPGTCPFVLPATLASGSYELRLYANNGYTRLATSPAFTVTAPPPPPPVPTTLEAAPASAAPGATVTASWSGIAAPSPTDWIGFFVPGAAPNGWIDWFYVSCSRSPGAARAAGSCAFALPASLPTGSYELRLFANNVHTQLAVSNAIAVTAPPPPPGPRLTVEPASVASGATVTASWNGIATPSPRDWIGLYVPGAGPSPSIDWVYVSCSKSPGVGWAAGSCAFALPAALAPGTYELRLYANDGYSQLAVSNRFTVSSSP
jgi:serine protease